MMSVLAKIPNDDAKVTQMPPAKAVSSLSTSAAAAPGSHGVFAHEREVMMGRARSVRDRVMERFVPQSLERDTEPYRRARLVTGFGFLGFFFGLSYASFYLLIGHPWGALIIAICSASIVTVPSVMRATGSIRLGGNLVSLILLAGFGLLCAIEGGAEGHAIAWLASVPLCALLLVDGREAIYWCVAAACVTVFYVALDIANVPVPTLCPERWHGIVTATGYMGLTLFMSVLGVIFEGGRHRAYGRMERALHETSTANARLKRLDAEKNEFLGVAAHDLKNPLGIVMGFAEMIAVGRGRNSERDRADARYIIEAADRMISLITQLLDVNAIEQGKFPLDIEVFDLADVSQQVIASFMAGAEKKRISIYAAGPLMPAWVLADPKATWRVLDNLLSNAIKYSPPDSDIYVRMRNLPDAAIWEVQDHGPGLTVADQARLFQKFTKLSARPTAGESSTGLGLSIVKMLAVNMAGDVTCQSKSGEGSTFSLRLPGAEAPAQTKGDATRAAPGAAA